MISDKADRKHASILPTSRAEALKLGVDRFFNGQPCKHGHIAPRYVSTTNCVQCQMEHARRLGGWDARPSKQEFLQRVKQLVEQRGGRLISEEYPGARLKMKVRCGEGHEFEATPDNLQRGRWCPKCKGNNQSKRFAENFRPIEELREIARREHGGDCLASTPVSMHTHVLWRCARADHEPFLATVAKVIHSNQWCPACNAERRRLSPPNPPVSWETVKNFINERGGEIVSIFGDDEWKGLKTRLRVRCANSHEWAVTGNNLLHHGSWCPECRNKGEFITRQIFEATFEAEFLKCRPDWLGGLELDGYSEDLRLAFEYQGPHHYTEDSVKEADARKRAACANRGVRLVEVEAIKQPFPPTNVLEKVVAAFKHYGFEQTPVLPTTGLFARELEGLWQLAAERGGSLISAEYHGSEPHEWHCGNPDHPSWWAEASRISRGAWCPSCAGNRPLGLEGLQEWGASVGLDLLDAEYRGTVRIYNWRCQQCAEVIRRSKGNIQQSLTKGYSACTACGRGITVNVRGRTKRADDFAIKIMPIINNLQEVGFTTLEALARELNRRGVPTARGATWHASTVKNLLERARKGREDAR